MSEASELFYPLIDVALVVRRHAHEVRNALNGMELELTLLEGDPSSPDAREAVMRLRQAITEVGRDVQGLSAKYGTETPSPILALQIAERWKADSRHVVGAHVDWQIGFSCETVCVESGLIRVLLLDLLSTSLRLWGDLGHQVRCRMERDQALFEASRADRPPGPGIVDSQQDYWSALRRLAERNQGRMDPEKLATNCTSLCLSLPVCSG